MKRLALIAIAAFICSSAALAQTDSQAQGGSVYSKIGVGFPVDMGNTASDAMGLTGVSYNENFVASIANPAHWGSRVYGLGAGGLGLQSYAASNNTTSVTNTHLMVNQFQLQLPIIRGKLGIAGSFSPVTRSSFRYLQRNTRLIGGAANPDTLTYAIENRGSGGANRAEFGFGWRINSNVSVGYAASAVFISQDDRFTGAFADQSYNQVSYTLETSGVGFGNRVGTQINLPGVFRGKDYLGIGASVSFPVTIDANRKETSTAGGQTIEITERPNLGAGDIKLPLSVSGGVSYQPGRLIMFATEALYEKWSDYENGFKPSENRLFTDRYKVGLGFQYFPYITGSDKFLSNFKYRIGASYDTGHLRIEGQRINTLMFSAGLGILSPNSRSSIDLSFEYGIRGTKSFNLIKEQIWGVRLSLNLAELMFFRPKLQ